MESAEREYLAMAKARISGSAPWTAKTSVWLRAPGGSKDSLDMRMVSRTEYGIREQPRVAAVAIPYRSGRATEQSGEPPGRAGAAMREFLVRTSHKPRPLPAGRWAMTQRWNDLLFAHWPIPAAKMEALLPDWLEADTFQGSAWLGAVPFWLDRIKIRGVPPIPGLRNFPDLNLRTYVRDRYHGNAGVLLLLSGFEQPAGGGGGAR